MVMRMIKAKLIYYLWSKKGGKNTNYILTLKNETGI